MRFAAFPLAMTLFLAVHIEAWLQPIGVGIEV